MHTLPLALLSALSCVSQPQDSDSGAEMAFLFSFVVLADPHIASAGGDHETRLVQAIDWVNLNAQDRDIELLFVVGDIGWGPGLPRAAELLGELSVTWVPLLGDNAVAYGDEQNFDSVFAPQVEVLTQSFTDYRRGQVEVLEDGETLWMQNSVFTYRGLRWVSLDWNSRSKSGLLSEFGDLHDVPGGSLPFLAEVLGDLQATAAEDVLLFSHHPMHIWAFNQAQMAQLTDLTGPISGRVAGAYAGHMHLNAQVEVLEGGYTAWVTDATWDDENTLRVVSVFSEGQRFRYEQELVEL